MKILLTGTSGFVGSYLQRSFANQHQVIGIERQTTTDLLQAGVYPSEYTQIDTLIHLAGRAHVMRDTAEDIYQAYASVNIDYTLQVAELANQLNIKRFVFLSSVKVNGESSATPFTENDVPAPMDAYGKTKLEAELALKRFCAEHQIELVIIRPPLIYGTGVKANFKQLIKLCLLPVPLPFASITNKRSFVSLENLVDFILLCSQHPSAANQTFLVSDNQDVSLAELIKSIRHSTQQKLWLFHLPPPLLKLMLTLIGKSEMASRLLGTLQVDTHKAQLLLGWKPKISFQDGIQQLLKEFAT